MDEAKESGETAARRDGILKEGERRTVTVLFSDMKGFTSLSERTDPEVMDSIMTRVFSLFARIIERRGGAVEKYIGDALVAVFGSRELHEDDPARAIESALEFSSAMRRPQDDLPPGLVFRTGIHSGLVTTGRRGGFDVVTGHTMAVASRLQSEASDGGILVSESAMDACSRDFDFSEPRELELKGKEGRIRAFAVEGRRASATGYSTPFVDRTAPLDALVAEYLRCMRGERVAVYLTGDGGVGKTRLVAEFHKRLSSFPSFRARLHTANPSLCGSSDYATVRQMLGSALGLAADPRFEDFEARLRERSACDEATIRSAWGVFLPEGQRGSETEFSGSLTRLFREAIGTGDALYPDILFIDNSRLADSRSREFFRGFLASPGLRLFIVLCDRVRHEETAKLFRSLPERRIEPLSPGDSALLVRALAPEGLSDDVVDAVVERAQGYPLFIEEYVKLVSKTRDLASVPDTIQTTVLAALERLEPGAKALARKLSVFRYPFGRPEASALDGRTARGEDSGQPGVPGEGGGAAVEGNLSVLVREGVLSRSGDGAYAFKHSIIREAVLESLLKHNRRVLHAAVAEMLREERQARPAEIFHNLVEAEDWDGARRYALDTRPRLPLECVPKLQRVLENTPERETGDRIELLFLKYATLYGNFQSQGLKPIVHEMYRLALQARNDAWLSRCYHLFMTTSMDSLDYRAARVYGLKAVNAYRDAGNPKGEANARMFLASCLAELGAFEEARAMSESIDRGFPDGAAMYAESRAGLHSLAGEYAQAREWILELKRLHGAAGREDDALKAGMRLLVEYVRACEYESAYPEPAGCTSCGTDNRYFVVFESAVAEAAAAMGDRKAAEAAIANAEYYLHLVKAEDRKRSHAEYELARACVYAGDRMRARALAESALANATRNADFSNALAASVFLARMAWEEGKDGEFAFFMREAGQTPRGIVRRPRRSLMVEAFLQGVARERGLAGGSPGRAGDASPAGDAAGAKDAAAREFLLEATMLMDEEASALGSERARARFASDAVCVAIEATRAGGGSRS